jgi:hypothetical protein
MDMWLMEGWIDRGLPIAIIQSHEDNIIMLSQNKQLFFICKTIHRQMYYLTNVSRFG